MMTKDYSTHISQKGTAVAESTETGESVQMDMEVEIIVKMKSATFENKPLELEELGEKLIYSTIQGWGKKLFKGSAAERYFTEENFNKLPIGVVVSQEKETLKKDHH